MRGSRGFSQAIADGEGISVVVEVDGVEAARAAESQGAEALVVRGALNGVREATDLPILWCGDGTAEQARSAGADAYLLVFASHAGDVARLERIHREALELGLDCAIAVEDEEELEAALDRVDPEIFLLAGHGDGETALARVLDLLPDVPAGRLAVAEVGVSRRDEVAQLERAGMDAVIVRSGDLGELVGGRATDV